MTADFGDELFEQRLGSCHVLESLALTLEKMLEGSYISSNTAEKIMKEASNQYHMLLKKSKLGLPSHYIMGYLQQYKQSDNEWTFSVTNPIISLSVKAPHTGVRGPVAAIDENFGKPGGPRTLSYMPLNAHTTTFCQQGTVKIKAIVDNTEEL